MNSRKKLLYIDDEENNLVLFQMCFDDKYDIFTTISPAEGIDIIKKENIKVLITDYKMPSMTGMDLIDKVKTCQPEIVCMILSSCNDNEMTTDKSKVFSIMQKPFEEDIVIKCIEDAFGLYELK